MHAWESIQKVLDYIEDNLAQSHSPQELAKACETLEDKSKRILDIALEYGFNSHEYFTKTFKNAFGITPDEYRNNPVRLNQIMKPDLLLGYTMIDENMPLITDSIVLEISRKTIDVPELYIGLSAPVSISQQAPLGETTGIDVPGLLWDKFHHQKDGIKGRAPKGIEFAVSSMEGNENGIFTYFVGASATLDATAYDDFVTWELPAAEYIVCSFEAENFEELTTSALGKSMHYLFGTWLPKHNLSTQSFSAEKYINVNPEMCKMELWVIPVPVPEQESR